MKLIPIPVLSDQLILHTFRRILDEESSLVRTLHTTGYQLNFTKTPPVTRRPLKRDGVKSSDAESIMLEMKWQELVRKGIARTIIPEKEEPGFYSPSFTIPKKVPTKRRLVNDLRNLNRFVAHEAHQLPGLRKIIPHLHKNDLYIRFDVENGYYNVGIDRGYRRYFRFYAGTKFYELAKLPMGFHASMNVFRAWLRPIINTLRYLLPMMSVCDYVDDALVQIPHSYRHHHAQEIAAAVRRILLTLNVPTQAQKCMWNPNRKVEFLGFLINSKTLSTSIPTKKLRSVGRDVRSNAHYGRTTNTTYASENLRQP